MIVPTIFTALYTQQQQKIKDNQAYIFHERHWQYSDQYNMFAPKMHHKIN